MTYALTFFVALGIAAIATPVSMKLAGRWGAIAYPGGRHVHTKQIPCLGGLAIYAAFWSAALIMQVWDQQMLGLFLGSTLILGVGIWDDVRGMRPLVKFIWQIAAAAVLIFFDFSMKTISLPFIKDIHFDKPGFGAVGLILMLFWVVGLVNTVNVSDGLDGLAAGICFIAALFAVLVGEPNCSTNGCSRPSYIGLGRSAPRVFIF